MNTMSCRIVPSFRRAAAMVRKETHQIFRDPSSIAIGIIMPILLLVLLGYSLNFDIKELPTAVLLEDTSPEAYETVSGIQLSGYLRPVLVHTNREAEQLLLDKNVDAIVRVPSDFSVRKANGDPEVQVIVHGTDANTARISQGYAQSALAQASLRSAAENQASQAMPIRVESRLWFNEANCSTFFLAPGLVVLIMTLIGSLLTSLVVAREWERGTFEALFVTPVRPFEILIGKTVPYFLLGMIGMAFCVIGSRVLFGVPLRGSLPVLVGACVLYMIVALGIGLMISSVTKSQFLASQITLVSSFLPAIVLSGFLYDLRSMPRPLEIITRILPARYFVRLLQTLFLAGDVWSIILPNCLVLAVMGASLMALFLRTTRKHIG